MAVIYNEPTSWTDKNMVWTLDGLDPTRIDYYIAIRNALFERWRALISNETSVYTHAWFKDFPILTCYEPISYTFFESVIKTINKIIDAGDYYRVPFTFTWYWDTTPFFDMWTFKDLSNSENGVLTWIPQKNCALKEVSRWLIGIKNILNKLTVVDLDTNGYWTHFTENWGAGREDAGTVAQSVNNAVSEAQSNVHPWDTHGDDFSVEAYTETTKPSSYSTYAYYKAINVTGNYLESYSHKLPYVPYTLFAFIPYMGTPQHPNYIFDAADTDFVEREVYVYNAGVLNGACSLFFGGSASNIPKNTNAPTGDGIEARGYIADCTIMDDFGASGGFQFRPDEPHYPLRA